VLGGDRQAEAGSRRAARPAGLAAVEPLEHAAAFLGVDPGSAVLDVDDEVAGPRRDADAGRAPCVVIGVVEQIGEDPFEAALIEGSGRRRRRVDLEGDLRAIGALQDPGDAGCRAPVGRGRRCGVRARRSPLWSR
jgi:hypothetical protein